MSSILDKKPYVYSFADELKSCITLVNYHDKVITYNSLDQYQLDFDSVQSIIDEQISTLKQKYGEKHFNILSQERDELTGATYLSMTLDAPTSIDTTARIKVSNMNTLGDRTTNTPILQLLTTNNWKVTIDEKGNLVICTYSISPFYQRKTLNSVLFDEDTHVILHLNDDPFDYRNEFCKIVTKEDYNKSLRLERIFDTEDEELFDFSQLADHNTQEVAYNHNPGKENKKHHRVISPGEIEEVLQECREDPEFIRIRVHLTNIHQKDNQLIATSRRCKFKFSVVHNLTDQEKDDPGFIDYIKGVIMDTSAAKTFVAYTNATTTVSTVPIPDFLSKASLPVTTEKLRPFIKKRGSTGKSYFIAVYMNKNKLDHYRIVRVSTDDLVKMANTLLSKGFYIFKTWSRTCKYNRSQLRDIYVYTNDKPIDIKKFL
jgi:hypothetical protein